MIWYNVSKHFADPYIEQSTSERAKTYNLRNGCNLEDRFLTEAKDLLELECGKRSLATVQALLVVYVYYVNHGIDRAGLRYRDMAYAMLAHLQSRFEGRRMESGISSRCDADVYRKAMSRAFWGTYCFERYGRHVNICCHLCRTDTSGDLLVSWHSPTCNGRS